MRVDHHRASVAKNNALMIGFARAADADWVGFGEHNRPIPLINYPGGLTTLSTLLSAGRNAPQTWSIINPIDSGEYQISENPGKGDT